MQVKRRFGTSFARCINTEWAALSGDPVRAADEDRWDTEYLPDVLDDPRIRHGKHRIVKALGGYTFSLLPYTKKKDLKTEWNEMFKEQHPDVPEGITLSKIRNLKREALGTLHMCRYYV
jgi:hypothetical protein